MELWIAPLYLYWGKNQLQWSLHAGRTCVKNMCILSNFCNLVPSRCVRLQHLDLPDDKLIQWTGKRRKIWLKGKASSVARTILVQSQLFQRIFLFCFAILVSQIWWWKPLFNLHYGSSHAYLNVFKITWLYGLNRYGEVLCYFWTTKPQIDAVVLLHLT